MMYEVFCVTFIYARSIF